MPSLKDKVDAYLGHLLVDRQLDYLRRGRRFKAEATFRLKMQYLGAVRLYGHSSDPDRAFQEIQDLEAEVTLRGGTVPPLDVQRCDFSRWWQEHFRRLDAGPEAWRDIERSVVAAVESFYDDCRRATKH